MPHARLFDLTDSLFISGTARTISAQIAAIAVRGILPAIKELPPTERPTAKIIPFPVRA